jgi:hypothetical protein
MPHTFTAPVIAPGVAGALPVTVMLVPAVLPQALTDATAMFPTANVLAIFTSTEFDNPDTTPEAPPDTVVMPVGNVQVYDVAPNTGVIEYVAEVNPQADAGPDIGPEVSGFLVIERLRVALVPQALPAVTVIVDGNIAGEILTVIAVVPCPESIAMAVIPVGTTHV